MDRRSVAAPLTVKTIDAALEVVVAVFQRYARYLMSATVYFDVTITDDWQAIFRQRGRRFDPVTAHRRRSRAELPRRG